MNETIKTQKNGPCAFTSSPELASGRDAGVTLPDYDLFERYVDTALENNIPDGAIAIYFNLYDDSGSKWSMEIVGTSAFDAENSDWACEELTDFHTRNKPLSWNETAEWDKILAEVSDAVRRYLRSGRYAAKLRTLCGIGVGFVDGDLMIIEL